ncbi:MAG TPA: alpha-xylosidase, partial [Deinococcales bacterium]|nr:alpha-xylosidase [Deinococcales bacterium]
MRFTDGNWMLRPGARPAYATEVVEALDDAGTLDLLVSTRPVTNRGDLVEGPTLSVRLSTPLDGVIRVRVTHWTGGRREPGFELPEDRPGAVEVTPEAARLTAGPLSVEVDRPGYALRFVADGRVLTHSVFRGTAFVELPEGRFTHEALNLAPGENVYGLGERFTPFVKNGQALDSWNRDGGTGSDQGYKCLPFYLTNAGYGVLVNHPGKVEFEIASERVSQARFAVPGEELEYLVVYGPTPREILERYTALTGRPALPPAWSFGLWLSTSFTTSYDEGTVSRFLDEMRSRDLPLSVFHFDCFWMRAFHWCDFEWDPAVFPDPEGMLARLHERGLRVSVWLNPYVAQRSALFEEARQAGFLLRRTDGTVWQTDQWQPGMGIVDFTNPAARDWFAGQVRRLARQGVDCIKTDFGERIPAEGVAWFDGADPGRMHNLYPLLYNRTVFEALRAERGTGEAVVFARSATTGGQQYPVHWGGDSQSRFESLAETLR